MSTMLLWCLLSLVRTCGCVHYSAAIFPFACLRVCLVDVFTLTFGARACAFAVCWVGNRKMQLLEPANIALRITNLSMSLQEVDVTFESSRDFLFSGYRRFEHGVLEHWDLDVRCPLALVLCLRPPTLVRDLCCCCFCACGQGSRESAARGCVRGARHRDTCAERCANPGGAVQAPTPPCAAAGSRGL